MLVIIMCLVVKIGLQKVNELKLRQEQNTLQEQYRVLQNKNYLVLDVDTSCTKQLLNSKDGIIRIMVTK
jgi:ubiquinone/menaquinone biosynthesis C-methylase UbiE